MPTENADRPRVFIDKVHLKGFKSIEDVAVNLNRGLNILIGKNGSGKSNFLELLNQIFSYNRDKKISFDYANINILSNDNHSFLIELQRHLRSIPYEINELDELRNVNEKFLIDGDLVYDNSENLSLRKVIEFKGRKIPYGNNPVFVFRRMGYESLYPLQIGFNLSNNKLNYIEASGSLTLEIDNLYESFYHDTLNFVKSIFWTLENVLIDGIDVGDDSELVAEKLKKITIKDIVEQFKIKDAIINNIKLYSPIENLRFNKSINLYHDEKKLVIDNVRLEFKINGNWMPWSQLSDGTKRLFYIIAEVTAVESLILLEEPELGIHPHQFNLLMDFLKEQSEHKQILISTHSPKALDHLSPEELDSILIAHYDLKKGTQIRHLTTKEINKAKKYMKEVGFFSDYWLLSDLEE